ncbi:hypothetical protein ACTXT7_011788 [Hymenolepis weldensis]
MFLTHPKTTISYDSAENCPLPPVGILFPKGLSNATSVEAANDDVRLHSSVRDSVKATYLMQTIESSMPKSATTGAFINSLLQILASQDVPKVTVPRNTTLFSSNRFEDLCYSLNTSLLHSLLGANCPDEQIVDTVKNQLIVSEEEETEEENPKSPLFRCLMFVYESGSKRDLSGCMLPLSAVESQNSGDPTQLSPKPLRQTLHRTLEKIQGGINI